MKKHQMLMLCSTCCLMSPNDQRQSFFFVAYKWRIARLWVRPNKVPCLFLYAMVNKCIYNCKIASRFGFPVPAHLPGFDKLVTESAGMVLLGSRRHVFKCFRAWIF